MDHGLRDLAFIIMRRVAVHTKIAVLIPVSGKVINSDYNISRFDYVCFSSEDLVEKGLPTVQSIAEALHVSPGYLSGLLKVLTGQSTQQHIHDKLIEKAKEKLSTTDRSVTEIAYELGFKHPQSFSKLFKTKTNLSPSEFRLSFN
jgi:AraC-like DNA-binding protein